MTVRKVGEAIASASYLIDAITSKPTAAAVSLALTPLVAPLLGSLQGAVSPYLALLGLCALDFYTAVRACRILGEPITSSIMREKGLPKLKDYTLAVMGAALTSAATRWDGWILGVVGFLAVWELYSIIGENLRRTSTRQFDWRRIPVIAAIAPLVMGARKDASPEEIARMPAGIPGMDPSAVVNAIMPTHQDNESERG